MKKKKKKYPFQRSKKHNKNHRALPPFQFLGQKLLQAGIDLKKLRKIDRQKAYKIYENIQQQRYKNSKIVGTKDKKNKSVNSIQRFDFCTIEDKLFNNSNVNVGYSHVVSRSLQVKRKKNKQMNHCLQIARLYNQNKNNIILKQWIEQIKGVRSKR